MPSSVSKVTKHLRKKNKDIATLHAESRSAKRLRRAVGRDEKIVKHATLREKANEHFLDRIRYFQNEVVSSPEITSLDTKQLQNLAKDCVSAYEPEYDALKGARRPGRPATSREDWLKSRLESERREYDVGYWIPDMTSKENIDRLRRWDGGWNMLSPIKFVRINRDGTIKESRWPPNGMS